MNTAYESPQAPTPPASYYEEGARKIENGARVIAVVQQMRGNINFLALLHRLTKVVDKAAREEGLEYLVFLLSVDDPCDTALAFQDFEFTLMVAGKSQKVSPSHMNRQYMLT